MSALTTLLSSPHTRPLFHLSALTGGLIWGVAAAVLLPGWAAALLLLASLVLVPLALALVAPVGEPAGPSALWQAAAWLQLPCAAILAGAFALPAGPTAGCLVLPWFGFTLFVAVLGFVRLWEWGLRPLEELCVSAGLIFLMVGGAWTVLSRWGARPLGFGEPIILLTGVHFHYAGLILPLLTGRAGRVLQDNTSRLAAAGVVAGVPLVALGINLSPFGFPLLEWLASCLLAAAAVLSAVLQVRLARRVPSPVPRVLLVIAGFSLVAGMVLAVLYATGTYFGQSWLSIPVMIYSHGAINALGFALPGLLAWSWMERAGQT